ncbi:MULTISPECIES: hypothetical protein [unclassified Brevundimonas]|uniref:hypothetical protein n=1 Tax=unclassified Brevundimonas TaxID=2622653 RepID=UPI003F8EDEEE
MKKQSILSAAALTTLAIAGAANASTLTATTVTGANVTAARTIASEVKLDAAGNAAGVVGLALTPSTGAILPSGNALLTVALTGGATFGKQVTAGAIVTNLKCAPTTTVSTGGGAAASSVTFLVSSLAGCDDVNAIHIALPVVLNGTSNVNVTTNLTTELGTAIDGGTATTATKTTDLISFAKAFDVKFTADTTATSATLKSGFKALTGDVALGTIDIATDVNLYEGIATATKVAANAASKAAITIKGDLASVNLSVTGPGFSKAAVLSGTTGTATATTDLTPVTGSYPVTAVLAKGTPVISGSNYTASVVLTPTSTYNAIPAFGPAALQPITREGTSYLIPWVASDTLAKTSTSNTVIRIANKSIAATGAVSLELLTSSKGIPASATLVPLATSIPAGGELVLTSASLQTTLGADFGRGDIRITVEGLATDLITRRFVQSTVNGALSEVSLGRNDVAGSGFGYEPTN